MNTGRTKELGTRFQPSIISQSVDRAVTSFQMWLSGILPEKTFLVVYWNRIIARLHRAWWLQWFWLMKLSYENKQEETNNEGCGKHFFYFLPYGIGFDLWDSWERGDLENMVVRSNSCCYYNIGNTCNFSVVVICWLYAGDWRNKCQSIRAISLCFCWNSYCGIHLCHCYFSDTGQMAFLDRIDFKEA